MVRVDPPRTRVRLLVLLALGIGLIAGPAVAGPALADSRV